MTCARTVASRVCSSVLLLSIVPSVSWAQGAIGGQVTDATGSVLPGVTVEAASPALIERSRQAVTDGQGRYLLTELRPGVYTVTFTLTGFNTMIRTGIELTAGFTANVNAQMAVGALEESVTVSGASPIVDVQSTQNQLIATREVQDLLPSARSPEAMGRLMLGAMSSKAAPDVGGSAAMQRPPIYFHGQIAAQLSDGFRVYLRTSAGNTGDYFNNGTIEEIQFTSTGVSAEAMGSGMRIDLIPKDGGNTFKGSIYGDYSGESWSSNNIDQHLLDLGLQQQPRLLRTWDFNPSLGGPIIRDKLWFHLAYRNWGVDKTQPGSFSEITGEPGHDGGYINSTVGRLTWQASQRHKITTQYSYPPKYRSGWGIDGHASVSPEAAAIRDEPATYNMQNKWTGTLTNRLLVTAGVGLYSSQWTTWYREDSGVTAPGQVTRVSPLTGAVYDPFYANVDVALDDSRGAYAGGHIHNYTHIFNYIASVSYVTGAHSFKTGVDIAEMGGGDAAGDSHADGRYDMEIRWRNGLPDSLLLRATPRQTFDHEWDFNVFAQEMWTRKRVTLNGGLRFERFTGHVPEQWNPAGTWVPARLTPAVKNIPNWPILSPRGGVSWDLFGTGRTALKFSVGHYTDPHGANFTRANDPMRQIVYTTTARWVGDFNANHVPDANELGPRSNALFGTVVPNTTYDPAVVSGYGSRLYSWNYDVTLQHELRPNLGIAAGAYLRKEYNQTVSDNRAITPADFDEFRVVAPQDPRLPDGGGEVISGLYVITDAKRPLSDPYTTFAKNYGDHEVRFQGAQASVNWRARQGVFLSGGLDWGQGYSDACYVVDTPQQRFCKGRTEVTNAGGLSLKVSGALPLPADWQLSGTFLSNRGPQILANWTTRDANGTLTFVNGSRTSLGATPNTTIQLINPGTLYGDRYVQLDLRGARLFRLKGTDSRLKVNIDLYNALNGNAVTARNSTYGPRWGSPTAILYARVFKLGVQLDF